MTQDEFLVFGRPVIGETEIADVVECLRSGWVGTGPRVEAFERLLEAYVGVEHVRCVSSCTAALTLGLLTLGVGPGDEVIVPSMTFAATANAVVHTGADPILVDCEPETGLIDLEAAEAAIGPRTRALVPVHLAGMPLDMERVNAIRDRYGIRVVEDAAHALGAAWKDRRIGGHGNLTAYSFYVTKNITTIEGGALAADGEDAARSVERLAQHGLSSGAWRRFSDPSYVHYEVEQPGFKNNMTDVQAAIGIRQLGRLDDWIEARTLAWRRYDGLLGDLPLGLPPASPEEGFHARHLYRVLIPGESGGRRDEIVSLMAASGIGTGVHYRGVHLHRYYRERYELAPEAFPVATAMSNGTLSLPLSPAVSEADQERVARALRAALEATA